ncbi:hypothetical protein ACFH26_000292 [Acinetobacter baumannii]
MEFILKHVTEFPVTLFPKNLHLHLQNEGFLLIRNFWDKNQIEYIKKNKYFKYNGINNLLDIDKILQKNLILYKVQLDLIRSIKTHCTSDICIKNLNFKNTPYHTQKFMSYIERLNPEYLNNSEIVSSLQCITNFDNLNSLDFNLLLGSHKWENDLNAFRFSSDLSVKASINSTDLAFISTQLLYKLSCKT